jgi:soluble lytic murein transglycosylase-like protein
MQLMPSVWIPAGLVDPHEVKGNLRVGSSYLKLLHERFGELALALAAYNAGPTTVERYGGVPPYRETRAFLRRIFSRFCPGVERQGL